MKSVVWISLQSWSVLCYADHCHGLKVFLVVFLFASLGVLVLSSWVIFSSFEFCGVASSIIAELSLPITAALGTEKPSTLVDVWCWPPPTVGS